MGFLEDFKALTASTDMRKYTYDFTADIVRTLFGDIEAAQRLYMEILKSPAFITNALFWQKFDMFIKGVYLSDDDIRRLSEKLTNDENDEEYAERIIKCIDSLENKEKTKYVINLTRSLMADCISRELFFRLLSITSRVLEEDVTFLKRRLGKDKIEDCESAEALANLGIMYISDVEQPVKYVFSRLAYTFYDNAIRYDNENLKNIKEPNKLPDKMKSKGLSNEDIEKVFENTSRITVSKHAPLNPKENDLWLEVMESEEDK